MVRVRVRVMLRLSLRLRVRVRVRLRLRLRLRLEGEWLNQFTWPRQAQYMVHSSSSSFSSCHNIMPISCLDL